MNKEMSIKQFIQAIEKLPSNRRQKQWLRWLSEYDTPGYYKRKIGKKRSASFAYNHLANFEMLLWIIQAAGISDSLLQLAKADSNKVDNKISKSAAIRKHVPWKVLQNALKGISKKTPAHWLQYWKPFQIKPAITEPWVLNHSAGNQFGRVKPGDIVWIISVEKPGRLITLGPIHVENVLNQQKAEALLGHKLWQADWHIVNNSENVHRAKYVDLSSIASRLRFESDSFSKLVVKDGKVSGTQFQQMRRLKPESSELIRELWHMAKSREERVADQYRRELDHLASLDAKRSVSVRREQKILRQILFDTARIQKCGICGGDYPVSLLVAAHIKPRAKCSDFERRDTKHNLVPLCLLGCDSLFEQGFISVNKGHIVGGPNEPTTTDLRNRVNSLLGCECRYWSQESKKYFDWKAKHSTNKRTKHDIGE